MYVGQLIGRLIGQARQLSLHQVFLIAGWVLVLTVMEIHGRESKSDLADAFVVVELLMLMLLTLALDFRWVIRLIGNTGAAVRNLIVNLFERRLLLGLDLRKDPPVKQIIPVRWRVVTGTLLAILVGLIAVCGYLPSHLRIWLHDKFYLGYLSLLVATWVAVSVAIFLMGFVTWAAIHDYFISRHEGNGERTRRVEFYTLVALLIGGLVCAFQLPAWTPLVLYVILMLAWTVCTLGYRDGFMLLWKRRDGDQVSAVDGHLAQWLSWLVPMFFAGLLIMLTRGHVLLPQEAITRAQMMMPITTALGIILSWAVVGGMTATVLNGFTMLRLRRGLRSQTKLLPTLHVSGVDARKERSEVRSLAAKHGWRTRFAPVEPVRGDVQVRMCQHLAEQESGWPLAVTKSSLFDPQTLDRLFRRHEIQSRRLVLNGLQRILKRSARLKDKAGTGCWIGLQHWFVLGVTRDKDSDFTQDREATAVSSVIGPPFHWIIPIHARRQFREMTSALGIDIIFVEDGVSFRRLTRVFRVMFEIYDIHAGKRQAEERDFNGLPGIRVMLHAFSLIETTHQVERGYPEPDYEDIGRARILHIFKDRGESEEFEPIPWETDDVPLLSGSF